MLTAFLFSYYYNIPSREGLDGDIRAGEGGADGLLGRGADIHADKRVDIRKLRPIQILAAVDDVHLGQTLELMQIIRRIQLAVLQRQAHDAALAVEALEKAAAQVAAIAGQTGQAAVAQDRPQLVERAVGHRGFGQLRQRLHDREVRDVRADEAHAAQLETAVDIAEVAQRAAVGRQLAQLRQIAYALERGDAAVRDIQPLDVQRRQRLERRVY